MPRQFLEESIRPGTSKCMVNHILFTDHHHYSHLSHEEMVAKYKGTVLGEYLDFEKMDQLIAEKKASDEEATRQREIDRNTPVTMEHVMRELCGDELYNIMKKGWR